MSWFGRHLNWTWFFAWIATPVVWYLVTLGVASVADEYLLPRPPYGEGIAEVLILLTFLIWLAVSSAVMFPVTAYVLRRKGRSLWWLLLVFSFLPFPLLLANRRNMSVDEHLLEFRKKEGFRIAQY